MRHAHTKQPKTAGRGSQEGSTCPREGPGKHMVLLGEAAARQQHDGEIQVSFAHHCTLCSGTQLCHTNTKTCIVLTDTKFHSVVTHGAEPGGAFRKEGNRASSVSAMLHFIQCRKHSKCIALKTFFIEVKFTSHKIHHLSHLEVYYSHLKCTVLRVFQSDCTTLYTPSTSTPPLLSFPQLCSSVLLPLTAHLSGFS